MEGLALLYGQQTAEDAFAVVQVETSFKGLTAPDLALKGMKQHHCLLEAYEKLNKVKIN